MVRAIVSNTVETAENPKTDHLKTRLDHSPALLRQPYGRHSTVRAYGQPSETSWQTNEKNDKSKVAYFYSALWQVFTPPLTLITPAGCSL